MEQICETLRPIDEECCELLLLTWVDKFNYNLSLIKVKDFWFAVNHYKPWFHYLLIQIIIFHFWIIWYLYFYINSFL